MTAHRPHPPWPRPRSGGVIIALPRPGGVWVLTADAAAVAAWVADQPRPPVVWTDPAALALALRQAAVPPDRVVVDLDTPHGTSPTHWTEPLRGLTWSPHTLRCVAREPSTPARLAARLLGVPLMAWAAAVAVSE